ncbi:hypothetical protein OROMI_001163 [Orobanche minor]
MCICSSFLTPFDALLVSLTSPNILVLFSKSGNTDELLRLVLCAKAKGAFLVGNSLAMHIGGVGCFYELDHSKLHPELLNSA